MSGNPFRRSQGSRLPDDAAHADAVTANHIANANTKPKKKKRVVIQTPPHSPEEPSIPRRLSDGRTGSPPPPVIVRDDHETDSTTTADSDLEQALVNTRRNSGGSAIPTLAAFGGQSGPRAPYNPFAKTLATSEAKYSSTQPEEKGADRTINGDGSDGRSAGRPMLDVDAFTQILLKGKAPPPHPTSDPVNRAPDNNSSTDTSTSSRQSTFDSMDEFHPESPRTSIDEHPDPDEEQHADDEHSSLMGPVSSRPVEEGPPAPPKHKHGRAYPQTVSFADFDDSIPATGMPARLQTPPISSASRPTTPRSPSDLNKPLPPPPEERSSVDGIMRPSSSTEARGTTVRSGSSSAVDEGLQIKKAPPPPPTTRRRGHAGSTHGRGRSSSEVSSTSVQTSVETEQRSKAPPAPPPSRRLPTSSDSTSPAFDTQPSMPPPQATQAAQGQMPPPPPSRRDSTRTGSLQNPTATLAPSESLAPRVNERSSPTATANSNAPPAPPPRRGGGSASKRESIDGPLSVRRSSVASSLRRTSGQSIESGHSVPHVPTTDVSAVQHDAANGMSSISDEATERNVLADLDAFQAEIDALRAQAARNG
ncbi:hypothetical protein BAUCODRAFT_359571 [Baudoinia panamericana UAMH 10762]|uniref:Uncharacterized protein n=1 Tax=Baudoinia panamericana (strain UAMH 10762) TaxID=717646 RepID=M2NKQ6_BAUPA|nr:uncharacterized protein BAUCODRAFT_359571 [Baudoinia panamericana UAMH 10762]EMD00020.1 hypothetical protein BAUCODRAFT_359571 [Baudoinia panamericana UAMH 10762]